MRISKEKAIEEHRKMWNWIAKETKKRKKYVSKEDYFYEHNIPLEDIPINHCYCCEHNTFKLGCHKYCPVVWANEDLASGEPLCCNEGSEYRLWMDETNVSNLIKLAIAIANLPERKDENEETN